MKEDFGHSCSDEDYLHYLEVKHEKERAAEAIIWMIAGVISIVWLIVLYLKEK